MGSKDEKANRDSWQGHEQERATRAWRAVLLGVVGATATSFVHTKVLTQKNQLFMWIKETFRPFYMAGQLRRTAEWVYTQLSRLRSSSSWRNATNSSAGGGFRQEAWKRYYRTRMQEEYEDERERVERVRRMQSVFNRERNKRKRSYESWRGENDPSRYQYIPREDWYYERETSYREQRSNYTPNPTYRGNYTMSHHYTVLGLDRTRAEPYSDAEIKTAFRARAMECHPDQNQENKGAAEAKFKEIMVSYEAIKQERKSQNS